MGQKGLAKLEALVWHSPVSRSPPGSHGDVSPGQGPDRTRGVRKAFSRTPHPSSPTVGILLGRKVGV